MPHISVIIPTRNRSDILRRTLTGYANQVDEVDAQLVVINDGSTDDTQNVLEQLMGTIPRLEWRSTEHMGPAHARNIGLEIAKASIIFFTGDDMSPGCDLLTGHIAAHEKNDTVAIVGRIEWDPVCNPTKLMKLMAPNGPLFNYHKLVHAKERFHRFFYTANLSINTSVLDDIRFDERFHGAAFEDAELGYRLIRRGITLRYKPDLCVYHHHHLTARDLRRRLDTMTTGQRILESIHPELRATPCSRTKDFLLKSMISFFSFFE